MKRAGRREAVTSESFRGRRSGVAAVVGVVPACGRKSPQTVKAYGDGVRRFRSWARETDTPAVLDRATVNAFVAGLLDGGAEPSTARACQLALRRFSAWLVDEGEIDDEPLLAACTAARCVSAETRRASA